MVLSFGFFKLLNKRGTLKIYGMDMKEILQYVKNHPSGKVKLPLQILTGFYGENIFLSEKFLSVVESDTSFCDVIFGWEQC